MMGFAALNPFYVLPRRWVPVRSTLARLPSSECAPQSAPLALRIRVQLLDISSDFLVGVTSAYRDRAVDGRPQRLKLGPILGRQRLEDADLLLNFGQSQCGPILRLLRPRRDAVDERFEALVHVSQISMEGAAK